MPPKPKPIKAEPNIPTTAETTVRPDFPITWTPIGICVETAEADFSHQNLADFVNKITLPQVNVSVINILELVEQEISANSDLGVRLKSAKQDANGELGPKLKSGKQEANEKKKKETNQEPWMPPAVLLLECLNAKSIVDRDFAHKNEAIKRKKDLEEGINAFQGAKTDLQLAQTEVLTAENTLKEFKEKEHEIVPRDSPSTKKAIPQPSSAKVEKDKNGGKSKSSKDKTAKPDESESPEDTLRKLELLVAQTQSKYEEAQQKVLATEAIVKTTEASLLKTYNLVQVYILLGLPSDPSFLASLANGTQCRLCAILNLKTDHVQALTNSDKDNSAFTDVSVSEPMSLVTKIKAAAKTSNLDDPIRQIGLIDVQYENSNANDSNEAILDAKQTKKPKGKDAPKFLPYDNIAKAVASSLNKLVPNVIVYCHVKDAVQSIKIPIAMPSEDVDTKYYNQLIQEYPENFINIPVILHCIVEQVVLHSVCNTISENVYWKEEKKKTQAYLNESFVKLGQKIHFPDGTNECIEDNSRSRDSQGKKETDRMDDSSVIEPSDADSENLTKSIKIFNCSEQLQVIHEFDTVEKVHWMAHSAHLQHKTLADVMRVTSHFADLICAPGKHRQGLPKVQLLSKEEIGAYENMIQSNQHFCLSIIQIYRKLKLLLETLLQDRHIGNMEMVRLEESLLYVLDSQFVELFPNSVIANIYSESKLNHPFERLIYDETEDTVISVLYAADGEYESNYSIPFYVSFDDFYKIHEDLKPFQVAVIAYQLEEHISHLFEKKNYYLLASGGLFGHGLPSAQKMNKEPQGTLYMDGNTYILRPTKRERRKDLELSVCFKDGLNICFFHEENRSISLQVSIPTGITIEINSSGYIYMFRTHMVCKSPISPDSREEDNQRNLLQSNDAEDKTKSSMGMIHVEKNVEEENWRCILPSGVVIRNMKKGGLVALFPDGNVSEHVSIQSGCFNWKTTNSKGYCVIQVGSEGTKNQVDQLSPNEPLDNGESKKVEIKGGEEKNVKSKTQKESKQAKKETPREMAASKKKKGAVETSIAPPEEKEIKTIDPYDGLVKVTSEDALKPTLYLLPKRRVVQIADFQTACHIESREDLVTTVQTKKDELIVYHSDGTHMYTSHLGRLSNEYVHIGIPSSENCSISQEQMPESANNLSISSTDKESPNSCDDSFVSPHGVESHSMIWQIQKENYPTVYSDINNTMMEFLCGQNQYKLKWCKESGGLHLSLPDGKCVYTKGGSVILDASSMTTTIPSENPADKVKDLDIWEHTHILDKEGQQQQRDRLYIFDLDKGIISHEDCTGNGFRVSEGCNFEILRVNSTSKGKPKHGSAKITSAATSSKEKNVVSKQAVTTFSANDKHYSPKVSKVDKHGSGKKLAHSKHGMSISKFFERIRSAKPSGHLLKGPNTRIFVFHEGGHGYEIFGKDTFKTQLEERDLIHISETIRSTPNDILLHTFVKKCFPSSFDGEEILDSMQKNEFDEATFGNISKSRKQICSHARGDLRPIYYTSPPVLKKKPFKKLPKSENTFPISFRHFREYPALTEEQSKEMVCLMENLPYLELDMLNYPSNVTENLDAEGQVASTSGASQAGNKKLDWSKESLRIVDVIKGHFAMLIQRSKEKADKEEAERLENYYRMLKKKSTNIPCKHLTAAILDRLSACKFRDKPFLLYFKCEEGLEALLNWQREAKQSAVDEILEVIFERAVKQF